MVLTTKTLNCFVADPPARAPISVWNLLDHDATPRPRRLEIVLSVVLADMPARSPASRLADSAGRKLARPASGRNGNGDTQSVTRTMKTMTRVAQRTTVIIPSVRAVSPRHNPPIAMIKALGHTDVENVAARYAKFRKAASDLNSD